MDNLDNTLLDTTTAFIDAQVIECTFIFILQKVFENRFQILKSKDPNFNNNP